MRCILINILLCTSLFLGAQNIRNIKIKPSQVSNSLPLVLNEIQANTDLRIYFLEDWVQMLTIKEEFVGEPIDDVLLNLFEGTDLNFVMIYPDVLIILKDPEQAIKHRKIITNAIKEKKNVSQYKIGEIGQSGSKQIKVEGKIIDEATGEVLPFASVVVNDDEFAITSDSLGGFSFQLNPGIHILTANFVDYEPEIVDLEVYENAQINIELEKKSLVLDEVVIQDRTALDITTKRIGQTQLVIPDIKRAPSFMGEPDLIRQIQSLPGVTTVGEAASGFNVRGGSVDQNLILYDGLTVFNSSHVFGLFSSFNADATQEVSFYKGGIPSKYGGRISSVLDIESKEGNYSKWNGKAGVGLITGNLLVNGPLKKDTTSIILSVRSTYSNWLMHTLKTDYTDLSNSSVFFYDGNLAISHRYSKRDKIKVSAYSSRDNFSLEGDTTYQWHNQLISANLNHQFSSNLGAEFTMGIGNYGYNVTNKDSLTASRLSYRISSVVARADFDYQLNFHKINFGWQSIYYWIDPGQLNPESKQSNAKRIALDDQFTLENAIYISDEVEINKKLTMEAGLRVPLFSSYGSAEILEYGSGLPKDLATIVDTLHFKSGQTIKSYIGLEPRLSFRWTVNPMASFKLGFNRMYQFLHLVTNTTAVTPVDIWQPSGYYFKPQKANQISVGYFKDFRKKKYGLSTEAYYKSIQNILDFKDGAELILNNHLETELLQGKGFSYGVETSFFKNNGNFTGSINYTFSRSYRRVNGPSQSESINRGKKYPANFDQPHVVNVKWKYHFTRRHYLTGNFTYHTGRPVTIPLSVFRLENTSAAYFSARNQYRIPDYHRLDLALAIEGNNKRNKTGEGTWVFSVYNVYGRKNPYTVFFRTDENGIPRPYQLSIIGTIFPSVSYNFKF